MFAIHTETHLFGEPGQSCQLVKCTLFSTPKQYIFRVFFINTVIAINKNVMDTFWWCFNEIRRENCYIVISIT